MKFNSEFKEAISNLPSKEKDKLILRLLKYDLDLANRLYFELLSSDSVQDRRVKMETFIKKTVAQMTKTFYSPGYLMIDMRSVSGKITEHVKITKDKYGEVSLNILLLNEVLKENVHKLQEFKAQQTYTFSIYVVARVFKILVLIKALHEDFQIEFEEGLKKLGEYIGDNPTLMHIAMHNGLDINWLYRCDIPEEIAKIHKEIRAKGFLK